MEQKLDDKHTCIQWIANQVDCPILTIGTNQDLLNTISIKQYCQKHPQLLGCYHNIKGSKVQNEPSQIGGICIANLEENWDIQCQIICDLLSSEDGMIGDSFRRVENHIPLIYFVKCKQLRISIESTYELLYGQKIRKCYEIGEQEIEQWSREIREQIYLLMRSALISLFLKREHLILLTRMILMTNPNSDDDQRLHKIEQKYERKEMQILRHLKFNQNDLDTFQTMAINIANLTFSYFKLHFPMNASLIIKEHIKFIQQIKQINFGGITVEQLLNYQRHRLSQEKTKLLKGVKLPEEQIMPKNINLKIDLAYVQYLQDKYFHPRNPDHRQPYQILNITNQQYKRMRITNREIFQSITSLDDIPSLQMINTNHIQPILNYDSFNVQFDAKFAKMMQRNQYVASTIKKYQQNHFKKQEFCLTTRSVCQEHQSKSILIRLDPSKLSILRQSVDAISNEVIKYKVDPKSVPLRQSKFLNSPSVNSSKNFQDSNQEISEKQSECKRLVKPIEKLILKPIDYQSVCFGEMQTTKQQSSMYPQIRDYPKILTQKEIELQLENEINNPNFPCMNQPDQERMRKVKQLREVQQYVQAKRFHTSSEREEYNAVYEVIYKKNSTTYQTMRQSIPLLNKKNVQNQLILLTNKYSRSEQLLTSLIASGAIKGKQSEIFEQFLKPIKISSSAKVLTPKARQMILRTKINLEQKVYNMK